MKPKLLDLFCKAGGAAQGYHNAGFEVVGIDHEPQKNYPFEFHQADVFAWCKNNDLSQFSAIHASPPCQRYSCLSHLSNPSHEELIEPVREQLINSGKIYVIENVIGAPLINPVLLCGSMFGLRTECGAQLLRHRIFETNYNLTIAPPCFHYGRTIGIFGNKARDAAAEKQHYKKPKETRGKPKGIKFILSDAQTAMGIDWMNFKELSQAIPPTYTEWIGNQILKSINNLSTNN